MSRESLLLTVIALLLAFILLDALSHQGLTYVVRIYALIVGNLLIIALPFYAWLQFDEIRDSADSE